MKRSGGRRAGVSGGLFAATNRRRYLRSSRRHLRRALRAAASRTHAATLPSALRITSARCALCSRSPRTHAAARLPRAHITTHAPHYHALSCTNLTAIIACAFLHLRTCRACTCLHSPRCAHARATASHAASPPIDGMVQQQLARHSLLHARKFNQFCYGPSGGGRTCGWVCSAWHARRMASFRSRRAAFASPHQRMQACCFHTAALVENIAQ